MKLLPPRSGSGRQIEMWMQQVSAEMTRINFSLARAYLAADQTVNDGAWTKVTLDTESFDLGNNFSAYKYTAPITGYYHVDFGAGFYNVGTVLLSGVASLYLNGAEISRGGQIVVTTGHLSEGISKGSGLVYLTAGQYLELYANVNSSDSSTSKVTGGSPYTFMSVHLIST